MPPKPGSDTTENPRHSALVRITHWLTVVCFFALLVSGAEIVVSHPRFYWGETGNANMHPIFTIPIPASRRTVPTGYSYTLPDQNGWSRALHFQSAWLLVFTGFVYGIAGFWSGHFRKDLLPAPADRRWSAYRSRLLQYLRRGPAPDVEAHSYNVLQRSAYLGLIFLLFPLIVWTGLAMSPSFVSAFPMTAVLLGGRQSARTLHFFLSWALVLFFVVHIAMVALSGFAARMRGMITGRPTASALPSPLVATEERP